MSDATRQSPFVVPFPKKRSIAVLLANLAISVGSLVFAVTSTSVLDRIIGAIPFVVCGYLTMVLARRIQRNAPVIVLDDSGLQDPDHGRVEWAEISSATLNRHGLTLRAPGRTLRYSRTLIGMKPEALLGHIQARAGRTWPEA